VKVSSAQKGMEHRLREGIMLPPETDKILHGYKEPLTSVRGGFGFIGTVAFNVEKTHIQCHACGFFFKSLAHHLRLSHGMKSTDYRERYGLMAKTPLVAPATLDEYRRIANDYLVPATRTPEHKAKAIEALNKYRSTRTSSTWRMERLNRLGRCPEQLIYKIDVLAKELKRTPTRRDFIAKYGDNGDLNMIYRTFETWNEAVKLAGLTPNRKGNHGSN
jgi:hypothetical protein